MKISIFGLGYVGCVSLGCLSEMGHTVTGIDVNQGKVDLINAGKATIVEEGIEELIRKEHDRGRLSATCDAVTAVKESEVSIICVGTPTTEQGHLELDCVYEVVREIAESLADKSDFHTIVIRSTVAPGTNQKLTEIIAEVSGKKANEDFAVVSNPEFMREGSSIRDFLHPAMIIAASESGEGLKTVRQMYKSIDAPIIEPDIGVAEIIKYINNSYHALKVVFANEVGRICRELGVNSLQAMEVFCKDQQLNISPVYFRPGFAYGGSCLPKDLSALQTLAHDTYVQVPVLNAVSESNDRHKEAALKAVERTGARRVAFLGLSFKAGTDDLRESPSVELVERLLGKGYEVRIHDQNVVFSNLTGRNRQYIDKKLPHLGKLLCANLEEALAEAEVAVIGNSNEQYRTILDKPDKFPIIDLAGLFAEDLSERIVRIV